MKPKLYVRERVYIPIKEINTLPAVQEAYTKQFFDDKACARCDYLADRFCDMCEVCPSYKGTVVLYKKRVIKGIPYIGLPIGDKRNIEENVGISFSDFKIVDLRRAPKFDYKVKFLVKLRPPQARVIKSFMKHKYGLLEAPPRFGKTVCMLNLSVTFGLKTLVLASQHEFLQQYIYHIEGNKRKGIPKCTNLPDLEAKTGKKLYGFPKTDEDFENFQIFTMTYHQFMTEVQGKNRFKKIVEHVGLLQVDEVHKAAAPEFSKVVSMFPSLYRMGVTGTTKRKDGKHYVIKKVLGPVVARSKVEALTPTVYVHETGIKIARPPNHWTYAMLRLAKNAKRNKLIVKHAIADVKAKHYVVIPLIFKKHIFEIVRMINEAYGKPIAEAFIGGGGTANKRKRDEILENVAKGTTKVVVGIRSLLQLGLNVPNWSAIYTVIPISNEPNYKQETSRVRTPLEGKQPIVRLFYDACMGQSLGCARNCLTQMETFKYVISKDDETKAAVYALKSTGRRSSGYADEDEEFTAVRAAHDANDNDEPSNIRRFKAGNR